MNDTAPAGWWQRNWKWGAPVGCLTVVALVVAAVLGLLFFIFSMIKSTDVYEEALSRTQTHPVVQRELGQPIEADWLVMGSISTSGSSGEADIVIPITGPNGQARIYAVASKSAGRWTYQVLEVEVGDSGQRINLLE